MQNIFISSGNAALSPPIHRAVQDIDLSDTDLNYVVHFKDLPQLKRENRHPAKGKVLGKAYRRQEIKRMLAKKLGLLRVIMNYDSIQMEDNFHL